MVLKVIGNFVAAKLMSEMRKATPEVEGDNYECCHQVQMFGFGSMKFLVLAGTHDVFMLEWYVERIRKRWQV